MTQSELTEEKRQTAFSRLLHFAKSFEGASELAGTVAIGAAAAAIYCLFPANLDDLQTAFPVLASLVAAISGNVLADILMQIASQDDPSLDEIEAILQATLSQTKLATARLQDLPTKRELYRAISLLDAAQSDRLQMLVTQNTLHNTLVLGRLEQLEQLLRQIGSLSEREPDIPQFDEDAALQNYLDWVQAQYDTMRVLSMTRPVPLESIYTDVYVLRKERYWREEDTAEREQLFAHRRNSFTENDRTAGVAILAQTNRLFMVGQPGVGKTTFLRWLALRAARETLAPARIPLYVELRRMNSWEGSLFSLAAHQLTLGGFPDGEDRLDDWLRQGRVLLLLDGLDEVLSERRNAVNDEIADLQKRSGESVILVTCRPHAETRRFEHVTYVQVADFTESQVNTFVRNWFDADAARGDSLLRELEKNEHQSIRELTRTPLLLALLCIAYAEKPTFPRQRGELYSRALRVVLAQWDGERGVKRDSAYGQLTPKRKDELLAHLAYHTFAQGQYFIPQPRLVALVRDFWQTWRQTLMAQQRQEYGQVYPPELPPREVNATAVIGEIAAQHGLLVAQTDDLYSFSHLTLQEYFTARYIVDNAAADTLPRLMQRVGDGRWREVFLLTAGMLYDAQAFAGEYLAALARMVAEDPVVTEMLRWGAQQSAQSWSGFKPPALRALLLYLALALARALAVTYDWGLLRDLPADTVGVIQHLRTWSGQEEVPDWLRTALTRLSAPAEDAGAAAWKSFVFEVEAILLRHWGLVQFWELSTAQLDLLASYLDANRLLLDCLALASVPDREVIEAQMLLPAQPVVGSS